jgi:hypothetical protein
MINWLSNYFRTSPQVIVDGLLYVLIAFFGAMIASFNSDEAAKWIAPWLLFWCRSVSTWISAALLALKMFRSTAFAEHVAEKKSGNTTYFTKPPNAL